MSNVEKILHDSVNQGIVSPLNYTTSEWQCPSLLMFRWLRMTLIVGFLKKCVVGEYDDTTTKQASVSGGQKVHTPSTLA